MKEILGDTYGVIVYQEQVIGDRQALAGFTLGEADLPGKRWGRRTTR